MEHLQICIHLCLLSHKHGRGVHCFVGVTEESMLRTYVRMLEKMIIIVRNEIRNENRRSRSNANSSKLRKAEIHGKM